MQEFRINKNPDGPEDLFVSLSAIEDGMNSILETIRYHEHLMEDHNHKLGKIIGQRDDEIEQLWKEIDYINEKIIKI